MGGCGCSHLPRYITAFFIQSVSYGINNGLSLPFLRHDKGWCFHSDRTVRRGVEIATVYLYIGGLPAGYRSLALSFIKETDGMGKVVSDSDFALYGSVLYLSDDAVFSGYAAYDLLSLSFIVVFAPTFLNHQIMFPADTFLLFLNKNLTYQIFLISKRFFLYNDTPTFLNLIRRLPDVL